MSTITGATLFDMYAASFKHSATAMGVAERHVARFLEENRDRLEARLEPFAAKINARNAETANRRVQAAERDAAEADLEAQRAQLNAERVQAEAALEVERIRLDADAEVTRARLAAERSEVQAQRVEVRAQVEDAGVRTEADGPDYDHDADAETARNREDVDTRLWAMFNAAIARMKAALDRDPAMTVEAALDHAFPPEVAETLRRTKKPLSRAWFLHYRKKADLLDMMLGETMPRGAQAKRSSSVASRGPVEDLAKVDQLVDIHALAEMLGMPSVNAWESYHPDRVAEDPMEVWNEWHGAILAVAEQLFREHDLLLEPADYYLRHEYYTARGADPLQLEALMELSADPDSPRVFLVLPEDGDWRTAAMALLETKNRDSKLRTSTDQFLAGRTARGAVLKNLRIVSMWPRVRMGTTPGKMFYREIGYY